MENIILSDPDTYPSEEVLRPYLKKSYPAFSWMQDCIRAAVPDSVSTWKYYNDGKTWLMKTSRKKKTLFWLSIGDGFFRTSFYFGPNAEEIVLSSRIPKDLKKQYLDTRGKHFRPVALIIRTKKDIEVLKRLLELKITFGR